jgi:PAS domain S-box-containing protein
MESRADAPPRQNEPSATDALFVPRLAAGPLFVVFAPLLVLVAAGAILGAAAWAFGWHRIEMLITAALCGAAAGTLAAYLLYRQVRQRQAASSAPQSVTARVGDIVETTMDPIITIDAEQQIVLFNPAAERIFGWPRDAVIGQPVDKLLPERFRERHRVHIERFARTGETVRRMGGQTVLTGLRANGDEFPIEASISKHIEDGRQLFTAILRDVSDRVKAERLIARREARLSGILDSAMDAIITIDESQHVVIFNKAAEAMFACPLKEALGAPLAWFIAERYRDAHAVHVRKFGETGVATRRMSGQRLVTGLRRNGEEFPIDASISQLEGPEGKCFTVVLRDVSERVRVEGELRHSKEELRKLAAAANLAREQEQSRIARELHDELAQTLTALQMDVAWCKARVPDSDATAAARHAKMEAMLKDAVAATRRIAAGLRPLMLDDLGLVPAVDWLVEGFTQRNGIPCELVVASNDLKLSGPQATAVFRIIQESLVNIGKHARASQVKVSIARENGVLTVGVLDDGVGFSPQGLRKPDSYGLLGLRERASLLGGEVEIRSGPGQGTQVLVRLPVAATQAQS